MYTKVQYSNKINNLFFYTFGCKVNQVEIESLKRKAVSLGCTVTDDLCEADYVIINTCTVTDKAEKKYRSFVRKLKKDYPGIIIVATGCLPAVEDDFTESDITVPIGQKDNLLDFIFPEVESGNQKISSESKYNMQKYSKKTRAFLKIQDGCDSFCSYCIIPFARGNLKSKDVQSVKAEFEEKLSEGYKELVLVGIHIGNYGKDTNVSFSDLLEELVDLPGDFRIRLSSIEVCEVDDKLIGLFEKYPLKICRHFHIPIQSATDKILALMDRNYTVNEFTQNIKKIHNRLRDVNIGTDVIVGFPSEKKEDFDQTVNNLYEINFGYLHVFPYSERKGTKAAEMSDSIPKKVRNERAKYLRQVGEDLKFAFAKKYFGKILRVLVEAGNKGLTDNYLTVSLLNRAEQNTFVNVEVIGVNIDGSLTGRVIND